MRLEGFLSLLGCVVLLVIVTALLSDFFGWIDLSLAAARSRNSSP